MTSVDDPPATPAPGRDGPDVVLDALLERAPIGFAFLDPNLRFVHVNAALAEMDGASVDAHLGRAVPEVLPDLWGALEPIYDRVLRERRPVEDVPIEGTTAAHPGRIRRWRASYAPVDGPDGELIGITVVVQEVTEELSRTRQLAELGRMLARAEALAEVGSCEEDALTGQVRWSPGLHRLLGADPDGGSGATVLRGRVHPDDLAAFDRAIAVQPAAGEVATAEVRIIRDDGVERLLEIRTTTARGDDGALLRTHRTVADVTRRRAAEQEREQLLARSVSAADAERRRLAEQLHNDAIQALTAALLHIDHAIGGGGAADLEKIRAPLSHANAVLRESILEMDPVGLVRDGLGTALRSYARHLLQPADVEVHVDVDLAGAEAPLPALVLETAYRIAQEALANTRRHADAARAEVRVRVHSGHLVAEVLDDGVGIDPAVASGGPSDDGHHNLGLRLMRERAALLHGWLEVAPRVGGGTRVAFRLPAAL